jgi:hypothetical protein
MTDLELKANPTAVTLDTERIGLPELFSMLAVVEADIADETALIKHKQTIVAEIRTAIEARLRKDGTASVTDAATGYKARIEQRADWKVTDRDALEDYARSRAPLGLIVEVVDEKAAIHFARNATLPVPGIEQVTSERFVVTPPKGEK